MRSRWRTGGNNAVTDGSRSAATLKPLTDEVNDVDRGRAEASSSAVRRVLGSESAETVGVATN